MLQVQLLLAREVEQPARGADDDVDALLQGLDLGLVGPAAVDREDAHVADLAGGQQVVGDLLAQLARGDDDERLRGVGEGLGLGASGLDVGGDGDALEEREAEAQRLAGAGLGLADDVRAREGDGERHLLDGEGGDDADGFKGLGGLGEDSELSERRSQGAASSVCAVRGERGGRVRPCRGRRRAVRRCRRARDHCRRSSARTAEGVPPGSVRTVPYGRGGLSGRSRSGHRPGILIRAARREYVDSTQQAHYHHTPESRTCDGRIGHVVVVTLIDQGLTPAGRAGYCALHDEL